MTNIVLNPFNEAHTYSDFTEFTANGILKKYDIRESKNGNKYVDLVLSDATGEIPGKFFNYTPGESKLFKAGDFVCIVGKVKRFNDAFQVTVEDISNPPADAKKEDYVKSADYSPIDMFAKIITLIGTFQDEDLKKLTLAIFEKYQQKLLYYPAAIKMHHAVRGGLLLHTLSIMTVADKVCQVYPQVDRDLLLCGAALHDIGKLSEMDSDDTGVAGEYTRDGNLVGHLVRGAMIVRFMGTSLKIEDEKIRLVEHMLLSHHGKPEFGAAVKPMFLEANLLHELDELDAKVYEFSEIASELEPETFSARQWALDDIRVYNHGRKEIKPQANILED
ncbi:MAG: HD domain-containing protein [Oscillospiraceae bacterium]|nr:HD domain-containing protein [Candidatus Limimonas coprohippi]MCQ2487798.1 HD domain-containing protein [Clostridia bacterium]